MVRILKKVLPLFILFFFTCKSTKPKEEILKSASNYLWSQQSSDGAWHSETHGILKGGESLTAYILWSLLESSEKHPPAQVKKAINFIRDNIHEGCLGKSDPMILDYPNYSTAYALRVLKKYGSPNDTTLIKEVVGYLLSQQFTERRGIDTTHLAYGAWGFGETNLSLGQHGHVDLSHTRRILEALKDAEVLKDSVIVPVKQFLSLLQKYKSSDHFDGGFFASSVTIGTNKGSFVEGTTSDSVSNYASYATATCDGILALKTLGLQDSHPQIAKAKEWLLKNRDLKYPQGIPKNTAELWHEVMHFYHLAVRAEAFNVLNYKGTWQKEIVEILKRQQNENGSFLNPVGGPNKEDDPLLATTFAMIAIAKSDF